MAFKIIRCDHDDAPLLSVITRDALKKMILRLKSKDLVDLGDEDYSPSIIAEEMSTANSEFYFLQEEDTVLGYLKLNYGNTQTDLRFENSLELQRLFGNDIEPNTEFVQEFVEFSKERAGTLGRTLLWTTTAREDTLMTDILTSLGFIVSDEKSIRVGASHQIHQLLTLSV